MSAFLDYLEYLWTQLSNINIIDIVDILIVAFLFYWVYKFVRDRRAGKLLVGLIFLVGMLIVSDLLDMHALNFILTNFFSVGIVAIVIVFQPELRSALEKVGGDSLKNFKGMMESDKPTEMHTAISEISAAAEAFSRSKTGALIVFERSVRTDDLAVGGTPIDAIPSHPLLGNIFYNKAPLHDGAVIIRAGRVLSAGCVLPLTLQAINKDLGTRHRAAMGISEQSDAVVLVVSEENGIISVAVDGKLKRNFNRESLEKYLTALLVKNEKKKKFIGRFKKGGEGVDDGKQ